MYAKCQSRITALFSSLGTVTNSKTMGNRKSINLEPKGFETTGSHSMFVFVLSVLWSLEPTHHRSYSKDLRWRIVWQRKIYEMKVRDIARSLFVAPSTVSHIMDRFDRMENVARRSATSCNHILHEHDEFLLVTWILENPGIYFHELQQGIHHRINVDCTIFPDVTSDQPFDGFDTHLSSAVAVGECHRAMTVVYPPIVQELSGGVGYKFRAAI